MIYIQISVWEALYDNLNNNSNLQQMINYVFISFFIFNITKSESGNKIGDAIDKGTIVTDLIKPINYRNCLFAQDAGTNIFQLTFIFLPSFIFFLFMYNLQFDITLVNFLMFFLSIVFAVIIAFLIKYIIGLFAFWLETSWYIPFIVGAIFDLFSGSIIPIWFYPDWLADICAYLPFRFVFFEPISIFLGRYNELQILNLLLLQLLWIVILYCIERFIWSKAQNKLVVHGG
ncbi:ABC transporter permease [Paenibacillus nuruki]|nr:ABC-2 family transporter protein [Paenibacillus nuruki]